MILVTGATGTVGRELVRQLVEKGAVTRVLVRTAGRAQEFQRLGVETVQGDLTDAVGMAAALRNVQTMFLLTPPSPNEAEIKSGIIDAAKKAGVRRLVLQSGAGASHNSSISQAQQHAKSEDHLKASGLACTILQPYFFMQNFLRQSAAIKSQGGIFGNYKNGRVAMVDARDIAAVATACVTEHGHEGRTYVITGSEAITHSGVAERLSAVLGRQVNYIDLSTEQLINALMSAGYPEWLANDLGELGEEIAAGRFTHTTDTVERVAKRQPIMFDQFAQDNARAFS